VTNRCRAWLDAWGYQLANTVANWPTRLDSCDSALLDANPEISQDTNLFSHFDSSVDHGFQPWLLFGDSI
jgi:hypothetical protein